jgi:hypothetical protein
MKATSSLLAFLAVFAMIYCTPAGQVQHIVLFRFKDNVTQAQKKQVMVEYGSLKEKCVSPSTKRPYILSFDAGLPNSPEGFDQKMEQGYILTFNNVTDRDYFVGQDHKYPFDPVHDNFKKFVVPLLRETGSIVFDFTVLPKP